MGVRGGRVEAGSAAAKRANTKRGTGAQGGLELESWLAHRDCDAMAECATFFLIIYCCVLCSSHFLILICLLLVLFVPF